MKSLARLIIVILVPILLPAASAKAAITPAEAARLTAAAQVVQDIRTEIPQEYWDRARCVAVIPELKKAAFIFGGEYGKGVMSCRSGDRWSAPAFIQLAKGSWGFQAGAEQVDVVLLVVNEQGVQKLLDNKVNLGADASVAAGPVGRQGQVGTDASLKAEILSYSRAQGLFAGIDISGGVLRPDEDANRDVYGAGATPRTILASRDISAPVQAAAFLTALATASPSAATSTTPAGSAAAVSASGSVALSSGSSPAPLTPTTGANDRNLRARIAEMQQTLDRLLSDAVASPVGTTGATATSNATVTVDRARLLQLRQQLEALMAAVQ
jgi:lipid-binding SYLF domain-containing protein